MSGKNVKIGKIVAIMCVVAMTALAGIAQANMDGGDGHPGKHRPDFARIAKKLGLTPDQQAQAKTIFQANRATLKPMFQSLRAERQNLRALIHADTVDEAAIRSETARIAGIQADLNVARAKMMAQFRAILTSDQLAKLKAMREKHRQLREEEPSDMVE